jgi:diacylglycerol kinase (ATP)
MTEQGGRRPILLIANPAAGAKPGGVNADEVMNPAQLLERLQSGGLEVQLHELAKGDDAGALARTAADEGRDVVVAGGDGTVGPVAAALVDSDASLGVIPLGTFNNIARGAGVPIESDDAVEVVVRGRAAAMDAASAWHLPSGASMGVDAANPPSDAATFFEAAGIGLDAAGFGVAQVGDRLGWLAAARAAWRAVRRRKTPLWIEADGKRYRTASPSVTICNGPFHGFGFALVPDADPTDGLLDVVIFVRMGRFQVLRHFMRVARGRKVHEPRIRTLRARQILVGGVRHTLPAHADGRSVGVTPIAVVVRPGALRLFVPESAG